LETPNQFIATRTLVVRVQRHHRLLQAQCREQRAGAARIFDREHIGARQTFARPWRQISKITNGCGHDIEPTGCERSAARAWSRALFRRTVFRRATRLAHYNYLGLRPKPVRPGAVRILPLPCTVFNA
jgi:hypothetical protein